MKEWCREKRDFTKGLVPRNRRGRRAVTVIPSAVGEADSHRRRVPGVGTMVVFMPPLQPRREGGYDARVVTMQGCGTSRSLRSGDCR